MPVNREIRGLNVAGSEEYLKRRAAKGERLYERRFHPSTSYDKALELTGERFGMSGEDVEMRSTIERAKAARALLEGLRSGR